MRAMTPNESDWYEFCNILDEGLDEYACKGNHALATEVLKAGWDDVDIPSSLRYFMDHGGYCDCEILANVERRWTREQAVQ